MFCYFEMFIKIYIIFFYIVKYYVGNKNKSKNLQVYMYYIFGLNNFDMFIKSVEFLWKIKY